MLPSLAKPREETAEPHARRAYRRQLGNGTAAISARASADGRTPPKAGESEAGDQEVGAGGESETGLPLQQSAGSAGQRR